MRTKEVEEAIKNCNMLLAGDITLHIIDDDGGTAYAGEVNKTYNDDLKTALSYIETLEQLPKKIKDKIKELEEDKQTILQAIKEAKESKDEEFLKYNREILYRINGEISVLKSIIGE